MPKDDPYSYGSSRPGPKKPGLRRREIELSAALQLERDIGRGMHVQRTVESAEFALDRQRRVAAGKPALRPEGEKRPKRRRPVY